MKEQELIGKKVYRVSHYGISNIAGTIDRVTPTQIIIGGLRLKRDTFRKIGRSSWDIHYYKLETPELNEAFEVKKIIEKIASNLRGNIQSCSRLEEKLKLEDVKNAAKLLGIS